LEVTPYLKKCQKLRYFAVGDVTLSVVDPEDDDRKGRSAVML